jgi:methyl-accepting chemotaxis protein
VSSASTELEAAAHTLTETAETTQQLSTVAAEASEEASVSVQSVASATEEMTAYVGAAAKGTAQVAMNITAVNRGASETGSACAQVLSSAQSLSEESNRLKLEVQKFLAMVRVT